jgi:KDO2-lipid IV(A) lauroyltransferase
VPVTEAPPRKRSLWKRFRKATRRPRNAVLARGIYLAGRAVGSLPVPTGLALGRALGRGAHRLLGTPRKLALKHVAQALPELGERARAQLVRDTFEHAGESFAELGLWRRLVDDPDYVRVDGLDVLDEALAEGRGAFAVTGHVGNWELLAATIVSRGYRASVVARRVNDERFNDLITRFRGDKGMDILLRDAPDFMTRVRDALKAGHIVAILMDQDSRGAGVFVPFFGRLAHTPPGAAVLALRTHAPVVAVFIRRRPEGGHVVTFERVSTEGGGRGQILDLTARFTAAIEAAIRKSPSEWVWWHERWRRRPEDE